MSGDLWLKDPAARLDCAVDWAGWLEGRTLGASAWRVTPEGLRVAASGVDGARAVATVEGGSAGCVYRLVNEVLASDGARDARQVVVRLETR